MALTQVDQGLLGTNAQYTGFKNRILNGQMAIDQRNAGASVTIPAAVTYTVDRWGSYGSQASKISVQQNAGSVTPPAGFANYVGVTVGASANVTLGAADIFQLYQPVEGYNVTDLAWGTASAQPLSLSFWVRSSLTGTFSGSIYLSASSFPFQYTINSANTWEFKTVSILASTSYALNSNTNLSGLTLNFDLGAGSNWQGTAGAWTGSVKAKTTGSVSLVTTNGATFYITGVQLEKGSTATSFDYRPYGTELQLCQRYYEKSFPEQGATPTSNTGLCKTGGGSTFQFNGVSYPGTIYFQVTKRAAPTVRFWSNSPQFTLGSWSGYTSTTGTDQAISAVDVGYKSANFTYSNASYIFMQGHWEASSEL